MNVPLVPAKAARVRLPRSRAASPPAVTVCTVKCGYHDRGPRVQPHEGIPQRLPQDGAQVVGREHVDVHNEHVGRFGHREGSVAHAVHGVDLARLMLARRLDQRDPQILARHMPKRQRAIPLALVPRPHRSHGLPAPPRRELHEVWHQQGRALRHERHIDVLSALHDWRHAVRKHARRVFSVLGKAIDHLLQLHGAAVPAGPPLLAPPRQRLPRDRRQLPGVPQVGV
mmetsp:Transcript_13633/g.47098  ORF Transcript_13633/g.47098 Transcript_13633/m.47098 type:complete len:227 (+) Transcript_13633:1720-2400(+)